MTATMPLTDETRAELLAAASAASSAALDLIETVRQGEIHRSDNVGGGEVLRALVDATVLVIGATRDEANDHLRTFLRAWLEPDTCRSCGEPVSRGAELCNDCEVF